MDSLRVLDLFCGAGGLAEGFRQAGFSIVCGADDDPDACSTFAANFPDAKVFWCDLREPGRRQKLLKISSGVEIVVGGPPCQAFSQVRNHVRFLDDPRNSLYREFVHVVGYLQPLAFVMENVPGLDQMGVRDQVVEDLSLNGEYRVTAQVVDAADFGVPQTRRRIVFLGMHHSLCLEPPILVGSGAKEALSLVRRNGRGVAYEIVEQPQLGRVPFIERLLDDYDFSVVTAAQALSDLKVLPPRYRPDEIASTELPPPLTAYQKAMREGLKGHLANVGIPRINPDTKLRLAKIPPGGNYRDLPDRLRERYLTGQRWGPHNGSGRLDRRHYYAYRRLHRDFWSWTLNTKADAVYHYELQRGLSVREFARLQSFPDRFVFTTDPRRGQLRGRIDGGANHSRYRQVGNAVPPLLARAIAESLQKVLTRADQSEESLDRTATRGTPASIRQRKPSAHAARVLRAGRPRQP